MKINFNNRISQEEKKNEQLILGDKKQVGEFLRSVVLYSFICRFIYEEEKKSKSEQKIGFLMNIGDCLR